MKTPTLEEVKEHFKDAKFVQENCYGKEKFKVDVNKIKFSSFGNYVQGVKNFYLWSPRAGYAKILSYKEPKEKTYKITREQIKQLKHNAFHENNQLVIADINNWFPEVFEEHKKELFSKPILSLDDLLSVWGDINDIELYKTAPLFKSFEGLAEAKLKEIGVNAKIV